jgi:hypothetical protein
MTVRRNSWTGRGSRRPLRLVGVVVAVGVLATACSGGSSTSSSRPHAKTTTTTTTPTSSTTVTPGSTTPGVSNPCAASQLTATEVSSGLVRGGTGAAVGAVFTLTNKSTKTCTLSGYPNLQLLGTKNVKLVTTVVQGGGPIPATLAANPVTLPPGFPTSFLAVWVTANATHSCPHGSSVQITPPGANGVVTANAEITACNNGTINVSPVQPNVVRVP